MRICLHALAVSLALCILPAIASADPPDDGPTDTAVLLPPQPIGETVKAPNTTRERYGEWSISGGVYLVEPVFAPSPAFVVSSAGGNLTRQVDFNRRLDIAANVGLGYVSERGWGWRGRWFQYDHGDTTAYIAAPGETITGMSSLGLGRVPVNGTVAASSHLAVNLFDVQATCNIEDAKWSHLAGIGVRYTHLSQDYRATLANVNTVIDLSSAHNLNGWGPSFALETKRRIGESGFAIYGQLNGAIVFGQARERYFAVNNGTPQGFVNDSTRVLPIGELEAGAEYQRDMGRAKLFLQAGFVGQIWFNGGNASNLDGATFSSASNSNFGFVGLALRGGVRY